MTTTAPKPLTPIQAKLLRWIAAFIQTNGFSPTVEEITKAFKWASKNAAQQHIKALDRGGWITRKSNLPRTIRPTEAANA